MSRMTMLEDSVQHHREVASQLQKRLSERRQECVSLGKELFRAKESARIANEVADEVEHQLEDLGYCYDLLRNSNIQQAARIKQLENRTLWELLTDWAHRMIVQSCVTEDEYYGLHRWKEVDNQS